MIFFVAAHDKNFGIGYKGRVPWPRMTADRLRLHSLTNGQTVVLGERSYHEYKDVRHAFNTKSDYVVSSSVKSLPDAKLLNSVDKVLELSGDEELWVIGGGSIFKQLLPYAQKMYLTEIDGGFEADTFFPKYDMSDWTETSREEHDADELNPYPYTFITLERKSW